MRQLLIRDIFKKFIDVEFPHLFIYDFQDKKLNCGNEFISFFVSKLYCRVFIENQTIVRKGEQFSEMYMIFKGQITISLETKNENEYFNLYPTNYFGDYQILLGLRSTEFYKASG